MTYHINLMVVIALSFSFITGCSSSNTTTQLENGNTSTDLNKSVVPATQSQKQTSQNSRDSRSEWNYFVDFLNTEYVKTKWIERTSPHVIKDSRDGLNSSGYHSYTSEKNEKSSLTITLEIGGFNYDPTQKVGEVEWIETWDVYVKDEGAWKAGLADKPHVYTDKTVTKYKVYFVFNGEWQFEKIMESHDGKPFTLNTTNKYRDFFERTMISALN